MPTIHSKVCCASALYDRLIMNDTYYSLCFDADQACCFAVVTFIRTRPVARLFRLRFHQKQWSEHNDEESDTTFFEAFHQWNTEKFVFKDKSGGYVILNRREFIRLVPLVVHFDDASEFVGTCEACKQVDLVEDSSELDESSDDEEETGVKPEKKRKRT